MNKTTKKILLRYTLAPILLLVFFWLIYLQVKSRGQIGVEWQNFKNNWQFSDVVLIALSFLIAPLNWLTEAKKWQLLVRRIEYIPLEKALVSVLSGIAFAMITPNKTGDFLGRILYLRKKSRLKGTIASWTGSLSQIIVSFSFGMVGMVYLQIFYPGTWVLWLLIVAVVGFLLLLYFYFHLEALSKFVGRFRRLRLLIVSFYLLKRYSRKELLQVLGIAFLRFCIYDVQFLILLWVFNARLPIVGSFLLAGLMFWLITVVPTFFVADIGVRGFVTGLVFINTGIVGNPFPVLAASYGLWLINLVLPSVIGGILALRKGIYINAQNDIAQKSIRNKSKD